jgi:NAD+ synthase
MERNWEREVAARVEFIRNKVAEAHADGIVYGNSGGKDSALVGILCKMACEKTVGIVMPAGYMAGMDADERDAGLVSQKYHIEVRYADLTMLRDLAQQMVDCVTIRLTKGAEINIAPRLRMMVLYGVAASENLLVAGTGNRSERFVGYFTKWGDGACDFNPIADLTVGEVYGMLEYLGAPESIIKKAPSAGLYEGQTDETDMGITYAAIDKYILTGEANAEDKAKIDARHAASLHKLRMPAVYFDTKDDERRSGD